MKWLDKWLARTVRNGLRLEKDIEESRAEWTAPQILILECTRPTMAG